ncbi:MAG: hypothetical protein WCX48_01535 [Bacteroidales bacterium]
MIWIKLGIILTGFIYAGILPYVTKKTIQHIDIDLSTQTLSFLSNKNLYGKKYVKGYKRLLFATAILVYIFFWLLTEFYDLGKYELLMRYIDYSAALLTLLAFIPHNIQPYSLKHLKMTIQRLMHNLLAVVVFLVLPTLIVIFQITVLPKEQFLGVLGLIIIGITVLLTIFSIIKNGITGFTEIIFINGISVWSIVVTIITFLS